MVTEVWTSGTRMPLVENGSIEFHHPNAIKSRSDIKTLKPPSSRNTDSRPPSSPRELALIESHHNLIKKEIENDLVKKDPITEIKKNNYENEGKEEKKLTPFERISHELANDHRALKEITLGKRIGFYRIRGDLGNGNFSQVRMAIHTLTKEKVAIKILDKTKLDQKTQRLLSREISSMEQLQHPNIIRLYEVVETLAKLHLVMEYANGGELFTKISNEGKLTEEATKPLFAQVVAAVSHMHEKNIIHRDIKAENIFLVGNSIVKVGDFGFSTQSKREELLNTFCGSPPYAAPELFKDQEYQGIYVDIWALGILLFFMVTGILPFRAETVAKLKKVILDGIFVIPSYTSQVLQDLVNGILKQTPHERFSLYEIKHSQFLQGQMFPDALESYTLNPVLDTSFMKRDEREAMKILRDLGITDEHIQQAQGKDARSSITGSFRIILHRIQKKHTLEALEMVAERELAKKAAETVKDNPKTQRRISRLCSII